MLKFNLILLLSLYFFNSNGQKNLETCFRCSQKDQIKRNLIKPKFCDDNGEIGLINYFIDRPELKEIFRNKINDSLTLLEKDIALEVKFSLSSNMNGSLFEMPNGIQLNIFRGSYLAPSFRENGPLKKRFLEVDKKKKCMQNLKNDYNLIKIINYDELDWPSGIRLTNSERDLFNKIQPKGIYWVFNENSPEKKSFQYKLSKDSLESIYNNIKIIIKEIMNTNPNGAVYIHCYGGHHRTGVIWGILQKCASSVNGSEYMNIESIIKEYKCHIGYKSVSDKGLYHEDNETIIRQFPCSCLDK
jgi:hypothetical protein